MGAVLIVDVWEKHSEGQDFAGLWVGVSARCISEK